MSAVLPFTAAAGAKIYVPRFFATQLMQRLHEFDEAQTDMETALENLKESMDALRTSTKRDIRDRATGVYSDFIEAADNSIMFIAYCMKNIHIMPMAARLIEKQAEGELSLKAMTLADPAHLAREMDHFRLQLMEGCAIASSLFSRETIRAMNADDDADIDTTFLGTKNEDMKAFHDWVEEGFMYKFSLPLNLYPRSAGLEREIKDELNSATYCEELMRKIRDGRLQDEFPGLSLDGQAPRGPQLVQVYQRIAHHVASFTPSETAHVIPLGAINAGPAARRARARARGPLGHGQTGRAPG